MPVRLWCVLCACLALSAAARAGGETPAEMEYRQAERQAHLSRVLPLLTNVRDIDARRRQLATALRQRQPDRRDSARQLVVRPFIADIAVIYVIDEGDPEPLVSMAMLEDWQLDARALDARALANLRAHFGTLPRKTVAKLPWLQVIDADDAYAASRLLLRDLWQALAAESDGRLVLGVPAREVVVFTSDPDPARLDQLADTVATVTETQPHAVSGALLEWTGEGWRRFERRAPPVK